MLRLCKHWRDLCFAMSLERSTFTNRSALPMRAHVFSTSLHKKDLFFTSRGVMSG
jgi:hypothetical protein